jgi:hypothetical protein
MFNYDDSFSFKIKGLIKLEEDNSLKNILIKKEHFDGDYYIIVNTLLYYAAMIYLSGEENPKRLDFNEWANHAYIMAVANENRED